MSDAYVSNPSTIYSRLLIFCIMAHDQLLVFVYAPRDKKGEFLEAIDLTDYLKIYLKRQPSYPELVRMGKTIPTEKVGIYYQNNDRNKPMIVNDDLNRWLHLAFPQI